jgi:hypothetical protein
VKDGVAVLLLVRSFALKHAIRRDKWSETQQLVVDSAVYNLLGTKCTCQELTCTLLSPLLCHLLAGF